MRILTVINDELKVRVNEDSNSDYILVGGDWNMIFIFPSMKGFLSSQLTNSYFFRGVGVPPTSILMKNDA